MEKLFDQLHPVIKSRRSGRVFQDQPVEQATLNLVLEAARWAPSCGNRQPWRFVVATEPEALNALHQSLSSGNAWARRAPVMVAVVTREDLDQVTDDGRKYYQFDTGLSAQNLILQAVSLGLMCHPMAGFDPETAKSALGAPPTFEVICLIAIGWPGDPNQLEDEQLRAKENKPRLRKPLSDIASFERWDPALESHERP